MTRILVTGATGKVGSALLPLLARNSALEVIAAHRRGTPIAGLEGRAVDFTDPLSLGRAFQGIARAFIVVPLHPQMVEMAGHVAKAARDAGVQHLVRISGAGAEPTSPYAVARLQGQADAALQASGVPCTFLRPKNFMQNFSTFMADMVRGGVVYSSQGEGRVPFIDVRDIAEVAANVLAEPAGHEGQAYTLTGPEALTNAEALDFISQATGRTIRLQPISEAQAVASMRSSGMPEAAIEAMSSLNQLIAAGYVAEVTQEVQRLTGHPARRFADFAREHAGVWR